MPPKRIIAKPRANCPIAKSRRKRTDHLADLPADISTAIIDSLSERELRLLPRVSPRWASLFTRHDTQPHFRSFVRSRFGLNLKPPTTQCWGTLYLTLRRERCHLCPEPNVAPFVYAGSTSLSIMLLRPEKHTSLTLFPICRACFQRLLTCDNDPFVPVVEHAELSLVFPHVSAKVARQANTNSGFLYSDLPLFERRNVKEIQYTLARSFAIANP